MWWSSVVMLEEEKIQVERSMANEDHLLVCRLYTVLLNARVSTSHIYCHCLFCVHLLSLILKQQQQQKQKGKPSGKALQFRQVLVCLTFNCRNVALWKQWVWKALFRAKCDLEWDVSKGVLAKKEISSSQWDLIMQMLGSWEMSCMV